MILNENTGDRKLLVELRLRIWSNELACSLVQCHTYWRREFIIWGTSDFVSLSTRSIWWYSTDLSNNTCAMSFSCSISRSWMADCPLSLYISPYFATTSRSLKKSDLSLSSQKVHRLLGSTQRDTRRAVQLHLLSFSIESAPGRQLLATHCWLFSSSIAKQRHLHFVLRRNFDIIFSWNGGKGEASRWVTSTVVHVLVVL